MCCLDDEQRDTLASASTTRLKRSRILCHECSPAQHDWGGVTRGFDVGFAGGNALAIGQCGGNFGCGSRMRDIRDSRRFGRS